jgi:hypothetical protein
MEQFREFLLAVLIWWIALLATLAAPVVGLVCVACVLVLARRIVKSLPRITRVILIVASVIYPLVVPYLVQRRTEQVVQQIEAEFARARLGMRRSARGGSHVQGQRRQITSQASR